MHDCTEVTGAPAAAQGAPTAREVVEAQRGQGAWAQARATCRIVAALIDQERQTGGGDALLRALSCQLPMTLRHGGDRSAFARDRACTTCCSVFPGPCSKRLLQDVAGQLGERRNPRGGGGAATRTARSGWPAGERLLGRAALLLACLRPLLTQPPLLRGLQARSSSLDQRGPPPLRWERAGDDRLLPPPSHRSGPWPGPPLGRPAYPGPPPRRSFSPPRRGFSPPRRGASPPPRRGFSPPRRGPSPPPRKRELSPPRGLSPPRRGPPPRPGLSPPRGPPSPRRGPSPPPYPRSPRDRSSSRPASARGGSPPLGGLPPLRPLSAEDEAARDAREMEDLAAGIKSLTRTLTLQECLK